VETIRRAREADVPDIVEIINHYITETPITFDVEPFTVETRMPWFQQFSASGRHQIFVAEREGRVLGWSASGPFRAKAAYETTAEASIYTAPGEGGKGLGRRLYERLFEALAGEDLRRLVAGITLPNEASVGLHERLGFERVGVFHENGRKFGKYWDVAWYERLAP
jgi:phosphinothricin acetyltransferase